MVNESDGVLVGDDNETPKLTLSPKNGSRKKKKPRDEFLTPFFSRMPKLLLNLLASGQYAPKFG